MAKRRRTTAPKAVEFTGTCATGICDPVRTQGLRAPAPSGTHDLVSLAGPGLFVAAAVSKQGGTNDLTFVILEIDGRNVTNLSFAAANNWGLTQLTHRDRDTMDLSYDFDFTQRPRSPDPLPLRTDCYS